MSIKTTIDKGVKIIFKVLRSLVHPATYTAVVKDGFSSDTETEYPVDAIIDSFSERDVQFLSFSNLIQPQDMKGLIRGAQLTVRPSSKDYLTVTDSSPFAGKYKVIAWDTDPAVALYTLLLRRV